MNTIKSLRGKYNPAIRRLISGKPVSIQAGGDCGGFPAVRYCEIWGKETDRRKARPKVNG